jgi:hypothetical protein
MFLPEKILEGRKYIHIVVENEDFCVHERTFFLTGLSLQRLCQEPFLMRNFTFAGKTTGDESDGATIAVQVPSGGWQYAKRHVAGGSAGCKVQRKRFNGF